MSEHRDPDLPPVASDPGRAAGDCAHASSPPPDVSLLLRAHSEQRLLSHEVIPVVREIETPGGLPEEQLPAAAAYLEVIWAEAASRARETDAALRQLEQLDRTEKEGLCSPSWSRLRHPLAREPLGARARRYHAAVSALREAVARRVTPLIAAPGGRARSAGGGRAPPAPAPRRR